MSRSPRVRADFASSRGPVHLQPAAVARPAHVDDVAALLSWAMRHRLALIPRGAGTGMPGGNTGPGVALDLGAFDAGPHLEDDGTALRAGAAVVAADADRAARSVGRHLPALPSSAAWCTLGGMVANDAAGARSFAHGPVHAWLREVTWVRADGTVETLTRDTRASRALRAALPPTTSPWPAVRKNSSGYGLDRFITAGHRPLHLVPASEGTLGIVTEVVIETEPLPAATGVALVGLGALDDLAGVAEVAADLGAAACEYFGRRLVELGSLRDDPRLSGLDVEAGLALLEFSGSADTVQAGLAAAVRLGGSLGGAVHADDPAEAEQLWALRHAASPTIARAAEAGRRSLQFIEDAVVPPARVGDYARAVTGVLDRYGTDGVIFGHLGDGNLHVNPLVDLTDARWRHRVRGILGEVTDVVAGLGGTLAGEHGDGRLRAPLLSRIWAPDQVAAFAALKDHFDPGGILNPGVVLPLPGQDPLDGFAAGLESA